MLDTVSDTLCPALSRLIQLQLDVFPKHADFLGRRFRDASQEHLQQIEELAVLICRIGGEDLRQIAQDYMWLSDVILREEIHFRRTGTYRLSTFEEADKEVYANSSFMQHYMNGLLMSLLWWQNHSEAILFYRDEFVKRMAPGGHHLEIGPGHGVLLYFAAQTNAGSLTAWDASETSVATTQTTLKALDVAKPVTLQLQDMFAAQDRSVFDSIAFSEVLEHLENPPDALRAIRSLLVPGGLLYVNAPVNSPAPDHLYLFREPEEVVDMVSDSGFRIHTAKFFPGTGASLERSRQLDQVISTCLIATAE